MAFVPVSDHVRVDFRQIYHDQQIQSTFWYFTNVDITVSLLEDVNAVFLETVEENLLTLQSTAWSVDSIYSRSMNSATDYESLLVPPSPVVGTQTGNGAPNMNAVVVNRQSNLTGRGNSGWIFMSGFPADFMVNNYIASSYGTAVVDWLNTLDTALAEVPLSPRIVRFNDNGAPLTTPISVPVSTWRYRPLLGKRVSRRPRT